MTPEQISFAILLLGGVATGFFFLGAMLSDSAWAHRTRVREMVHKEKMAIIQRDLTYGL